MSNIFGERYIDYYHFGEVVGHSTAGTYTKKLHDYYTVNCEPNDRNITGASDKTISLTKGTS